MGAYIEITGVTAGGVFQPALAIKRVESEPTNLGTPSRGPCGSSSRIRIASPDGSTQRLLLFTANSGDSQNTSVVAHYNLYDCNETSSCGQPTEYSTDTTAGSAPIQQNGGSCRVIDRGEAYPLPTDLVAYSAEGARMIASANAPADEESLTDANAEDDQDADATKTEAASKSPEQPQSTEAEQIEKIEDPAAGDEKVTAPVDSAKPESPDASAEGATTDTESTN